MPWSCIWLVDGAVHWVQQEQPDLAWARSIAFGCQVDTHTYPWSAGVEGS